VHHHIPRASPQPPHSFVVEQAAAGEVVVVHAQRVAYHFPTRFIVPVKTVLIYFQMR
jgi:hypothetical protein